MATFFARLPRWYVIALGALFICYIGGWFYTIHLANTQQAAGLAYVMPVGPHDSTSYANLTQALLHGHFAEPGEEYEYFHTPGYPAFAAALYAIFGSYFAVTFAQILLVFATALMVIVLGREVVSYRVGLFASLLFLINPVVPANAFYIVTDTLFMFLLTLGILLLVRYAKVRLSRTALLAGCVFAGAIYVRPMGFLALPIFLAPIAVLPIAFKEKLYAGITMVVIIAILLVPWMMRNYAHSGVFAFSSLVPLSMAYINIPHFWSDTTGISIDEGIEKAETLSGVSRESDALGYPKAWYDLASAPELNRFAVQTILGAPVSYAVWHLYNSLGFFINPAVNIDHPSASLKRMLIRGEFVKLFAAATTPWWLFAERIAVLAGLLLFICGAWILRRKPLAWAFAFIVVYLAALGGPSAQARYRLPVEPLLSVFIVTGAASLAFVVKRRLKNDEAGAVAI